MNPQHLVKSVRNARNAVAINVNRALGREFVPRQRHTLCIETSSLCNLDCCFCAYGKKQTPKITMSDELFANCISQALDMDYRDFDLTPCTGDVFMDRRAIHKLDFLEREPRVRGYGFYTNFTVLDTDDITHLAGLRKYGGFAISAYGHDLASFLAITKSTEKVYRRLLTNLAHLLTLAQAGKLQIHVALHAGQRSVRGRKSELLDLLDRFKAAGASVVPTKAFYNNWGGFISNDDLQGLPIEVASPDLVYKNGACARLFTSVQILASGVVNGCSARDADATLQLGDINMTPLRDIVSSRNPAYMALIDEQQRGEFRPACRSCDFYASIYHNNSGHLRPGVELQTVSEFKAGLG